MRSSRATKGLLGEAGFDTKSSPSRDPVRDGLTAEIRRRCSHDLGKNSEKYCFFLQLLSKGLQLTMYLIMFSRKRQ